MLRTVEAIIDAQGQVHLLEPICLTGARRARVTILAEEPGTSMHETALLSQAAFAEGWTRRGWLLGDLQQYNTKEKPCCPPSWRATFNRASNSS